MSPYLVVMYVVCKYCASSQVRLTHRVRVHDHVDHQESGEKGKHALTHVVAPQIYVVGARERRVWPLFVSQIGGRGYLPVGE